MTEPGRFAASAAALLLASMVAACGSSSPTPAPDAAAHAPASARVGDLVVRASAVPTADLGEAVAGQYGIERDPDTVLLLVGVRRGEGAAETAVAARASARATDLLGNRQAIALREVRSGAFVDYVGTARVIAPDTLRFDVEVVPEGGAAMSLRFNRDFFPR